MIYLLVCCFYILLNNISHIWRHHHYGKRLQCLSLTAFEQGGFFIELHHLCQGTSVFVVLSERMPQFRYLLRQAKGIKDLFSWKMNYEMNQYISRACTSKQVKLMKTKFLKMKTRHNISQMKLFTIMISWLVDDRSVTWTSFCDRSVTWTSFCDRSVTCTPFWAMFSL